MKKIHLLAGLVILLASCGNNSPQEEAAAPEADTLLQTDSIPPAPANQENARANIQQDSIIRLAFLPDSNTLTAQGHLDDPLSSVICYLPVTKGRKLTATLVPEKQPANIRFNQVFMPDGSSDGPFGQTLEYELKQKGTYKLYIGPSLMANDAYRGRFELRVKVIE